MKKIFLLLFLLLFSCKKLLDIDEDHGKSPTPKVYSVEISETSNGNLIIENRLDYSAYLLIKGELFETHAQVALFKNNIEAGGCTISEKTATIIKCSITLYSYYDNSFDSTGTYWVRVQNLDDWSVENVTLTIY
ncbi:MAG TPA: hypothetical protein DHW82_05905 [Spirochaetia bacterium]|nr:MAG: hypothetical protein A2Y41_02300 [Spirochaetes bacterium GWB1_36_13]HCL56527.1 hypothetical protein [Spirochaetia bacterium]